MKDCLSLKERETRAQYYREWRAKNKDKVREYNRTYWQRKAANGKLPGGEAVERSTVSEN